MLAFLNLMLNLTGLKGRNQTLGDPKFHNEGSNNLSMQKMKASRGVQKFKAKSVCYAYGKPRHFAKYYTQRKEEPRAQLIEESEIIAAMVSIDW